MISKKILAIIPARGGSKGLPRKNIVPLQGKPLIAWTIEAGLRSRYITKTIVTSDDKEILGIAKESGADIILRPPVLATDSATSEDAIEHAINSLKEKQEDFDYLILLQPTSPLRNAEDIDNAVELFFSTDSNALISVNEIDNKILKAFTKNESQYLVPISDESYPFKRRQELPVTYMSNGAIYIIRINEFLRNKKLFGSKTIAYKMGSEKSMDIDTYEDLEEIERFLM